MADVDWLLGAKGVDHRIDATDDVRIGGRRGDALR
jgi:hypothetical protein